MMPKQKPGKSKQDYRTPQDFIAAVKSRLHISSFEWDLAADASNTLASGFYSVEVDSLKQDWASHKGWLWLNPPYNDIEKWVHKAALESAKGAKIAMLVPASVGANWWKNWVEPCAYQLFLNGRLTFQGCDSFYPKDCTLLLYTPYIRSGNAVWNWREHE
jgi:phage N-6-adenine-methyltransferase